MLLTSLPSIESARAHLDLRRRPTTCPNEGIRSELRVLLTNSLKFALAPLTHFNHRGHPKYRLPSSFLLHILASSVNLDFEKPLQLSDQPPSFLSTHFIWSSRSAPGSFRSRPGSTKQKEKSSRPGPQRHLSIR